jgi:hypothetical protein
VGLEPGPVVAGLGVRFVRVRVGHQRQVPGVRVQRATPAEPSLGPSRSRPRPEIRLGLGARVRAASACRRLSNAQPWYRWLRPGCAESREPFGRGGVRARLGARAGPIGLAWAWGRVSSGLSACCARAWPRSKQYLGQWLLAAGHGHGWSGLSQADRAAGQVSSRLGLGLPRASPRRPPACRRSRRQPLTKSAKRCRPDLVGLG